MLWVQKLGRAGIILLVTVAGCLLWFTPRSAVSAAVGDVLALGLLTLASAAFCRNAVLQPRARAFWLLFAFGSALWAVTTGFWSTMKSSCGRNSRTLAWAT